MWKFPNSTRNDNSIETKLISKDQFYLYNTRKMAVKPHKKYRVTTRLIGIKGKPCSIYLAVMILGSTNKEIARHIRWMNDFSGNLKEYSIVFTTKAEAKNAVLGYRINIETPFKSDITVGLDHSSLKLEEISSDLDDTFDKVDDFRVPALPSLNNEEEDLLERKIVWIFGSPRSGTTWLGAQLLRHPNNIIWNEPYIGWHLGSRSINNLVFPYRAQYFFSWQHQANWLPTLRKLILARTYSEAPALTKNVIIKEPNGSGGADIIMECLPNSKLIFLLRDGRDVVDSYIDAHRPNSWNPILSRVPLLTKERRRQAIKSISELWKMCIEATWKAYQNHNPDLRLLVRYEDLRNNTFIELRKIYDFLRISISDDELQKIVDLYNFKGIPASEKGAGKFNRSATPGRWKQSFSKEEQELMNAIMGETLTQKGYAISMENAQHIPDDKEHSIRRNYKTWQNWKWEKGGEEWNVSPEWKQSLINQVMLKYMESGKAVLEIGPGAGRWTESLQKIASSLILVDLSDKCIELCKQRFHHCDNIQYFVNNGASLDFIPDKTVDFIWSFDVFVHINPSDTEKYIKEFNRILVKGGRGIIHHPAEGDQHGGWRSRMTAELFSDMLKKHLLTLVTQFDSWGEKDQFTVRGHRDTITVFEK